MKFRRSFNRLVGMFRLVWSVRNRKWIVYHDWCRDVHALKRQRRGGDLYLPPVTRERLIFKHKLDRNRGRHVDFAPRHRRVG